ncbi:unnamed protein product [Mycena citricolor]|uniref:Uncharacterized protein n=1 Tax=Mycena citricolor TaxID=2018698 RepID=A0AAD2HB41_9AGAR|nr:unnamed protein product [Mycena citricolor]CAK5271801.1 unnamed protein product [Mycena citricolor]
MSFGDVFPHVLPTFEFPDRDPCFGDPSNLSTVCQVASQTMLDFLNITTPEAYLNVYCLNPPDDSCGFGYCPNPDVASPAVRYSMYFTSFVSAILLFFSPNDVTSSFYAQLLNIYSLIIAAIFSIIGHNLTHLHCVIALALAASPLTIYLVLYVLRSLFGKQTRLDVVFGPGHFLNRALVLVGIPLWIAVLVFAALPSATYTFQQAACDSLIANNHVTILFFTVFFILFLRSGFLLILMALTLVIPWTIAIYRARKSIWAKKRKFPLVRIWRKVTQRYPFIYFYTAIIIPHLIWICNIEVSLILRSTHESFTATYGQLLAIFVTVPPFISLAMIAPRMGPWFIDLAWVRLLTCRRNRPLRNPGREESTPVALSSLSSQVSLADSTHKSTMPLGGDPYADHMSLLSVQPKRAQ